MLLSFTFIMFTKINMVIIIINGHGLKNDQMFNKNG